MYGSGEAAIRLVENTTPDITTSGSLHSFQYCVRAGHDVLDGTRQTLLMDADIVYDRRALGILLDEMAAFASALSARHTGQTLDDEPLDTDTDPLAPLDAAPLDGPEVLSATG